MAISRTTRFRHVAGAAAVAAAALVISGCSTTPGGGSDDNTLTILWEAGGQDSMEAVIAEFEKQNPGIDVQAEYLATDPYFTQIRTRLAAGNAADVLWVWPGNGNVSALEVLAPSGYLADLSDEPWVEQLPEALRQYADYDGKYYAFLTQITGFGQMFNDQALEESGLSKPTTWDEVLQFCVDAREAGKVAYSLGTTTLHESQGVSYALTPQLVYGEDPDFDEKLAAGETTFADSGWKLALEKQLEMVDAGCFNEGFSGADMDEAIRLWSTGEAIANIGIGVYMQYNNNTESTFSIEPFPGSNDPSENWMSVATFGGAAVNAKSGKIDLAKEFVAFLGTPEIDQLYIANAPGDGIGTIPSLNDPENPPTDAFAVKFLQYLDEGKTVVFPDQKWPNPEVQRALHSGMQEALQGRITVDQVLDNMQAAYEKGALD